MDLYKKRLLYRSNYLGSKELDLIIGNFLKAEINNLSLNELKLIEELLMTEDSLLQDWLIKNQPIDMNYAQFVVIVEKILKYISHDRL